MTANGITRDDGSLRLALRDAHGALDVLGAHLRCSVCLELPRAPASLKCLHYFCGACLRGVFASPTPRCPTCRRGCSRREVREDARFGAIVRAFTGVVAAVVREGGDDDAPYASQIPGSQMSPGRKGKRRASASCIAAIRAKMPKINAPGADEKEVKEEEAMDARDGRARSGARARERTTPRARATTVDGVRAARGVREDVVRDLNADVVGDKCAFCKRGSEVGERAVEFRETLGSTVAHETCALWAPLTTEKDGELVNVASEAARARGLKCAVCKKGGAASGCSNGKCHKSYHIFCAFVDPGATFDEAGFSLTCAKHSEGLELSDVLGSTVAIRSPVRRSAESMTATSGSYELLPLDRFAPNRFFIASSFLSDAEKKILNAFCEKFPAEHEPIVTSRTTHVVMSKVDELTMVARKKSVKYFKGILNGSWIVSVGWLRAGMRQTTPALELPFEIKCDLQGNCDGPVRGRTQNKLTPLFAKFHFVFVGSADVKRLDVAMDLAQAGGAKIARVSESDLVSRRIAFESASECKVVLVTQNKESQQRYVEHLIPFAKTVGAVAIVFEDFLLDSISSFDIQQLDEFLIDNLELKFASESAHSDAL